MKKSHFLPDFPLVITMVCVYGGGVGGGDGGGGEGGGVSQFKGKEAYLGTMHFDNLI